MKIHPHPGRGILISSGDVTLDLNGFTIRKASGPAGSTALSISGPSDNSARNVTIRNGHISGTFATGISLSRVHNVTIEDVAIQGTSFNGIDVPISTLSPSVVTVRRCRILGEPVDRVANPTVTAMTGAGIAMRFAMACVVEDCVIANIAGNGIQMLTANSADATSSGIIRGCVISRCGANGIDLDVNATVPKGLLVERCTIDQCGDDGIYSATTTRVVDCIARNNGGNGFHFPLRLGLISGCIAEENGADGIRVLSDSHVTGNACDGNGTVDGAGIHVLGSGCRIEGNSVTDNDRGLDVDGAGNLIIKNTAAGNTTNFDLVANNKVGVIVAAPNSAAISGSSGGGAWARPTPGQISRSEAIR